MVLERLRQQTAASHAEVESMLDLVSPDLSVSYYIRVLQVFLAFFGSVEEALERACPEEYRELWAGGRRAGKLGDDLKALRAAPDESLGQAVHVPEIHGPGEWLGCLYVVEGSRLGGQMIARHLEKHFGWSDGVGYSFFAADPEQLRTRWRQVKAALEKNPQRSNQIVGCATQTFDSLKSTLTSSQSAACILPQL